VADAACQWSVDDETLATPSGALLLDDLEVGPSCLLGCVALRELSLQGTQLRTKTSPDRAAPSRLHKLDLSNCWPLKAMSNLAPATSFARAQLGALRDNLTDLQGLDKLVALETLDVTNICKEDFVHPAAVPSTGHAVGQRGHHRTLKYHPR
jgi:hypothetical protein